MHAAFLVGISYRNASAIQEGIKKGQILTIGLNICSIFLLTQLTISFKNPAITNMETSEFESKIAARSSQRKIWKGKAKQRKNF
jgi:hypothetical protein